jgi:prepilin-type N-terminal cleavage/methylation domain-containing protein/prepilin-type processing-associated H-X9-DG protein
MADLTIRETTMDYVREHRGCAPGVRSGLTLLEVLVVIAIVGVLIGLAVPAVQRVRDTAARARCMSNLKQLALAAHLYSGSHHKLPEGCGYPFLNDPNRWMYHAGLSWHTSILPYVEQDELWRRAWEAQRQNPSGSGSGHDLVMAQVVPIYLCPSESRRQGDNGSGKTWGLTSYVGVAGTNDALRDGIFHRHFPVRLTDITDGTSNTLMIGERVPGPHGIFGGWYAGWGYSVCRLAQIRPAGRDDWVSTEGVGCPVAGAALRPGQPENACDVTHFWSWHIGGANFAFADGSVRFLRYEANSVLPPLATRAGGEVVELP